MIAAVIINDENLIGFNFVINARAVVAGLNGPPERSANGMFSSKTGARHDAMDRD